MSLIALRQSEGASIITHHVSRAFTQNSAQNLTNFISGISKDEVFFVECLVMK